MFCAVLLLFLFLFFLSLSSLLHGVTRILDMKIDIGNKEMENLTGKLENVTSGEENAVLITEKLQQVSTGPGCSKLITSLVNVLLKF